MNFRVVDGDVSPAYPADPLATHPGTMTPEGRMRTDTGGANSGGPSGITATASFTPVAEAYGAGDIISTAQEFAFTFTDTGVAVPVGSTIRILTTRLKIGVTAVPSGMTSFTMPVYTAAPATASQGNNDAWAAAAADLALYRGTIALGTPVDLGAFLFVRTPYQDFDVTLVTSSLFGTLVTTGAHTAAAVAREVTFTGIVI